MNNTLLTLVKSELTRFRYISDIVIIEMDNVFRAVCSAFKQRKANIIIHATMKLFGRIKVLSFSYFGVACGDCGSDTRIHAIFGRVFDSTEIQCIECDYVFNVIHPMPEPKITDIFQFPTPQQN